VETKEKKRSMYIYNKKARNGMRRRMRGQGKKRKRKQKEELKKI
jgi:hypothetical protein